MLRDFEAYYAAGATWRAEADPYSRDVWRVERGVPGVVATRDELLPYVGPPYALAFWALFARLPYGTAALAWAMLLTACTALLGFCIARIAGLRSALDVAALVVLGAGFGPLTSGLALGQAAVAAFAGVVAATLALAYARVPIVAAIGASGLAMLQPNVAATLFARLGDRRALLALAIAAVLALGIGVATLGSADGPWRYASLLSAHAGAEATIAIQFTVTAIAAAFGATVQAGRTLALALDVVVVGTTVWAFWRQPFAPEMRVAVACAGLGLVLPFSHEHDLAVALFPAVLCLRRARGTAWMLSATATVLVAVDWLGFMQRPSGFAQSVALAFGAACAVVALGEGARGAQRIAPFFVAAGAALVGALVAAHPLGVWPYALDRAFHAPAGLDATGVWHLEQVRSGLAGPNALSAAMRVLSLAGCALLWGTSLYALRYRRS